MTFFSVLAFYLLSLAGTFAVVWQSAEHKTEALLDYAVSDLRDTMNEAIDVVLVSAGQAIVHRLGSPRPLTLEATRQLVGDYNLDELTVVDRAGKIVGASECGVAGRNMSEISCYTRAFMVLTNGTHEIYSQPLRSSAVRPDRIRKYLGVAFPNGNGFIQIGYDEERLAKTIRFTVGNFLSTWCIGESGYYICANDDGSVIEAPVPQHPEALGMRLSAAGFGHHIPRAWADGTLTFERNIFGEKCYCRRFVFAGHNVYCVLPAREFFGPAYQFVLVAAAILLIVFFVFGYVIGRMMAQQRRIAELRRSEDAHREKDLAMAKSIQTSSLPNVFPPFPQERRMDLYAHMDAAKEVGGDFYDFYRLDADRIVLVMADVSGKGVPGAMFMMRAKATLKACQMASGNDVTAAVREANRRLCEGNEAQMFVTCWTAIIDLRTGAMNYVNAGHNPPYLRRGDGSLTRLSERSGLPLAAFDDMQYRGKCLTLQPGDLVVLFTDGVTEAKNIGGELYGESRLEAVLRGGPDEVTAACLNVRKHVFAFGRGAEQADDITLLTFRYNGAEGTGQPPKE